MRIYPSTPSAEKYRELWDLSVDLHNAVSDVVRTLEDKVSLSGAELRGIVGILHDADSDFVDGFENHHTKKPNVRKIVLPNGFVKDIEKRYGTTHVFREFGDIRKEFERYLREKGVIVDD